MNRLAAILGVGLAAAAAGAGDWTQFRNADGSATADERGLPARWGQAANLRWKAALPGRGLSSPVVAAGKVYVTASSGPEQQRLHVLCFDVKTGKQLWERQFRATGSTLCHPKTNMAAPTPVTDGRRVYALFATCDLVCLDAAGDLAWYRALRHDYPTVSNNVGMAASPVLCRDVLVVQMENAGESFVAGIDTRTGQNRWKVERPRVISWVTPLVVARDEQAAVLVQSPHELTAFDPRTGAKLWGHAAPGLSTIPSPAGGDGLVLAPAGDLLALKVGSPGEAPKEVWRSSRLRAATATPLVYRGRVYALNSAGVLACADAATGKVLWQERAKGPYSASPVAADGKVYLVNEEGTTTVFRAGDEPKMLGTNPLGETILATPSVADGALFLRSDGHLYCISEQGK
jgi:outer membrane protein assembly factor BamB